MDNTELINWFGGFSRCRIAFAGDRIEIYTKWKWPEPSNKPALEWPDADDGPDQDDENIRAIGRFHRNYCRINGFTKLLHNPQPKRRSVGDRFLDLFRRLLHTTRRSG